MSWHGRASVCVVVNVPRTSEKKACSTKKTTVRFDKRAEYFRRVEANTMGNELFHHDVTEILERSARTIGSPG